MLPLPYDFALKRWYFVTIVHWKRLGGIGTLRLMKMPRSGFHALVRTCTRTRTLTRAR